MANPMFRYDEAMTDLIVAACRKRLSIDPVALDFGGLIESLDEESCLAEVHVASSQGEPDSQERLENTSSIFDSVELF